jgi:hypothetical protein
MAAGFARSWVENATGKAWGVRPAHGEHARPGRVLLMLACVWLVGILDLFFTVYESEFHHFTELNPLAAHLVDGRLAFLVLYKLGLTGLGSGLLLALRRQHSAEIACRLLTAAYVLLAIRWFVYFQGLYSTRDNWIVSMLATLP